MNGFDFFTQPVPSIGDTLNDDYNPTDQPHLFPDWNDWMEIDYQNSKEDINNERNT